MNSLPKPVEDQFRLFVHRNEELIGRRIHYEETGFGYSYELDGKMSNFKQPDEELLRSFLLTFRLFVLKKEPTYFLKIRNSAEKHINPKLDTQRTALSELKRAWNNVLKNGFYQSQLVSAKKLQPEKILDAYLNGEYFHSDQTHDQLISSWKNTGVPIHRVVFLDTVMGLKLQIMILAKIIRDGLEKDWFDLP